MTGPSAAAARLSTPINARALGWLAHAGMFVFGIVMALVGAIVPALSERLPLTPGDIGTLLLVMNFAMLVASLVVGMVMDRGGLKMPLAAGAALVALGLLVIGGSRSYAALQLAVASIGLGGGALNGGTNTLVADLHEDPGRKAAALNLLGVFFGVGALILPFSLGALLSRFGVAPLLYAASVLCIAIALAAAVLSFPPPKQRHGWPLASMPRFLRMPVIGALALLLFFQSGNEFLLGGYVATFLTRELNLSVSGASYWLAAYWGAIMAARLVLSRLLLRANPQVVVVGGALLSAAAALIVAIAPTAALALGGTVLTGLALAGIFPSVLGLTGARFREHSGTVFGILFTIALCGGMTIPWAAGLLAEAAGLRAVFVFASANFLAIAALSAVARRLP